MYIEWSLVYLLLVRANRELVKDVLTCRPLENSVYKSRHPDDTDDPDAVGMSSEDEAEGMGDILGVSRRLNKPPPAGPLLPEPPVLEEEGMIKVPKDLKRAQGILKDILGGRKVHATWEEVPFEVPEVQAGDTNCELCYTFHIRKSQLLAQLSVAYILTGFCQCTCNCFWFLFCLFMSFLICYLMPK